MNLWRPQLGSPLLACVLVACSSESEKVSAPGMQLPHFNDISSAPTKIQTAAKAVVRIRTAGQTGTGFVHIELRFAPMMMGM